MEKLLNKSKEQFKKKVNSIIDGEFLGWPPGCQGIFNQPERPYKTPAEYENAKNSENE